MCKKDFSIVHYDLWDRIEHYEKKTNQIEKAMKNYISNLQKKEKVKYENAFNK